MRAISTETVNDRYLGSRSVFGAKSVVPLGFVEMI